MDSETKTKIKTVFSAITAILIIGGTLFVAGRSDDFFTKDTRLPTDRGQEYGLGFDRVPQSDGSVNLILYSGVKNVPYDRGFTRVEDALEIAPYFHKVYLTDDENYQIGRIKTLRYVEDGEYMSVEFDLGMKDSKLAMTAIPVEVYNYDQEKAELNPESEKWEDKYTKEATVYKTFLSASDTQTITLDELTHFKPGSIIKFGDESTTIQLQDANTENLDDTYMESSSSYDDYEYGTRTYPYLVASNGYPTYQKYMILRFNTTGVPDSSVITNATLSVYMYDNRLDSGDSLDVSAHRVYQFPYYSIDGIEWDEGDSSGSTATAGEMNFNERPQNSTSYNMTAEDTISASYNSPADGNWLTWSVTVMTGDAINGENNTSEIYLYAENPGGSVSGNDVLAMRSKEYATTSLRPYLNITYSAGEPECTDNTDCALCEKCISEECVHQSDGEDLKGECGTTNCYEGNCDGIGGCDVYSDDAKHGCNLCEYCHDGSADGSCDLVPQGQDPNGDCAGEDCDGAGACETGVDCTISTDTIISTDLDCTGKHFHVTNNAIAMIISGAEVWAAQVAVDVGSAIEIYDGAVKVFT